MQCLVDIPVRTVLKGNGGEDLGKKGGEGEKWEEWRGENVVRMYCVEEEFKKNLNDR